MSSEIYSNLGHSQKWRAFMGIAILSFGAFLDYTIVNVALPVIQTQLKADLNELQWVMNIYFLALCILATIMGRCGDLFGRKRLFYFGSVIFGLASVLAGLAPSIGWLIVGRLLQGIGAAIVFPLGPSLVPDSFPKNERAKAIALLGSLGGVALAAGPVLGGLIVDHWGWRWIFFINVPMMLLGFMLCSGSVREFVTKQISVSLDWKGMSALAVAMSGIVLSLIRSAQTGWQDPLTLAFMILGILAGILLVRIERRQENPLIDFIDFANPLFYAGAALGFLAGVLSAVTLFFDPLYLQIIRQQSPQLSGMVLFAIPISVVLVSLIIGWLIHKLGLMNTILMGIFIGIVATLLHACFTTSSPMTLIIIAFIFLGGVWAMYTVGIVATQTVVGPTRASVATGTIVTMFNIGGSIGLAIAVVVYHAMAMQSLKNLAKAKYLETLIANPAQFLTMQVDTLTHSLFNKAFMHGFTGVMYLLLFISIAVFISILLGKLSTRREKKHIR